MRSALPLALLLPVLPACESEQVVSPVDQVDLLLFTPACEPDVEPPFENWMNEGVDLTISWDVLCTRDDAATAWFGVKVTRWDDRADDMWKVSYVEPDIRAVFYGEEDLPGVTTAQNPDAPDAQVLVEPRELVPGDYRIEVWDVPDDPLDTTTAEAKLTVLGGPE